MLPGLKRVDRRRVQDLFGGLPRVDTPERIWDIVSDIQVKALSKGIGPFSIPDLIIAAVAFHHGLQVFARDRYFNDIASVINLALWADNS